MKNFIKLTIGVFLTVLFFGCSSKENKNENTESKTDITVEKEINSNTNLEEVEEVYISESKKELAKYYQIPFINDFYRHEIAYKYHQLESLVVPDNLEDLPYEDLRLLRNEIFARNGYLFTDGFLRGHFNKYKWYMPIFNVDTFKLSLTEEEQEIINTISREETRRKANSFIVKNGISLYNADLLVNRKQFRSIAPEIEEDLYQNNFSIVNANRQMPFYIYDENAYQYIPHYITTDLYLFILHKYFSKALEKLDENYLSVKLKNLLEGIINEIEPSKTEFADAKQDLTWADTYAKIALSTLTGENRTVSQDFSDVYATEMDYISNQSGTAKFIENRLVSYKELKPRGHYTKTDQLKNYFKTFKWISLNGININDEQQLRGMLTIAFILKSNPELYQIYNNYTTTIEKLAGQEDNVSIRDLIKSIGNTTNLNELISEDNLENIRTSLASLNKERIKKVFGENFTIPETKRTELYFLSSTYSISGEIFSKLVHVDGNQSKRPFPKGLDLPAVFRNPSAQKILLKEYKETQKWDEYGAELNALQTQFDQFEGWDDSYSTLGLKTALSATAEQDEYPGFMKTDAYNRKELSTMLSSWTHIKHDLILYQEKPFAAESGQGGGPEPPKHYSYVEPNIEFWEQALELTRWLQDFSSFEGTYKDELERIVKVGTELRNAAIKQQKGESLTDKEQNELAWIGGEIEHILLGLLETDHLPEREKSMALIADVYSYNSVNLNVAVGHADDIYVVVPINGEYHIARGSVFSYYEFQDSNIYTDEEWRKRAGEKNLPKRPEWLVDLIKKVETLEGQMEFRYAGY